MATQSRKQRTKIVPVISDRAWFDPRLMLSACKFYADTIAVPAGTPKLLAAADPNRVAIGFVGSPSGFGDLSIAPWGDPQTFGITPQTFTYMPWFTVREHLLLPVIEWWGRSLAGTTVRVITITRTT